MGSYIISLFERESDSEMYEQVNFFEQSVKSFCDCDEPCDSGDSCDYCDCDGGWGR